MCGAQMNSRAQLRRHRQQPKQHAAVKCSSFSWNMTIFLLCHYPWFWNVVTLSTVVVCGAEATRTPSAPLSLVLNWHHLCHCCPWFWSSLPKSLCLHPDFLISAPLWVLFNWRNTSLSVIHELYIFLGGGGDPPPQWKRNYSFFICFWSYSSVRL